MQPEEIGCQRRYQTKEVSSQRRYLAKEGIYPKEVSSQRSYLVKEGIQSEKKLITEYQPKSVTLDELQQQYISISLVIYFFILFLFNINVQLLYSFIGMRLERLLEYCSPPLGGSFHIQNMTLCLPDHSKRDSYLDNHTPKNTDKVVFKLTLILKYCGTDCQSQFLCKWSFELEF